MMATALSAYAVQESARNAAADGRRASPRLQLAVGFEDRGVWISGHYKQLGIRKYTSRFPLETSLELRHDTDTLSVTFAAEAIVVTRNRQSVLVDSAEALEALQNLLGGSSAVFAARATLSEFAEQGELRAPELNLLSFLAFVTALAGDVNAPGRLAHQFASKHRGALHPIRWGMCREDYTTEMEAAWNERQKCMLDVDHEENFFGAAYRRLACNTIWISRAESAWMEYVACRGPR